MLSVVTSAWWTLVGLATAANVRAMRQPDGSRISWDYALRSGLSSAWLWIPITLAIVWLVRRFPLDRDHWRRALPVHLSAVAAIVLLRMGAVWALNPWVDWYDTIPPFGELLITSISNNLFPAVMLIGMAHALFFAQRASERERAAAELQARLAEARLQMLKTQLNPHFLFNALNSIAEMVHRDADAADRMLVGLSELLRGSLDHADTHIVPLSEELRLLDHYLDIERARLGDRLRLDWRIDPATVDAPVPHLLLQPLVENAIKHGVAPRAGGGHIRVSTRLQPHALIVEVSDDGPGPRGPGNGLGIGLANAQARLECLYGPGRHLELLAPPDGGTLVRLTLPHPPSAAAVRTSPTAAAAPAPAARLRNATS